MFSDIFHPQPPCQDIIDEEPQANATFHALSREFMSALATTYERVKQEGKVPHVRDACEAVVAAAAAFEKGYLTEELQFIQEDVEEHAELIGDDLLNLYDYRRHIDSIDIGKLIVHADRMRPRPATTPHQAITELLNQHFQPKPDTARLSDVLEKRGLITKKTYKRSGLLGYVKEAVALQAIANEDTEGNTLFRSPYDAILWDLIGDSSSSLRTFSIRLYTQLGVDLLQETLIEQCRANGLRVRLHNVVASIINVMEEQAMADVVPDNDDGYYYRFEEDYNTIDNIARLGAAAAPANEVVETAKLDEVLIRRGLVPSPSRVFKRSELLAAVMVAAVDASTAISNCSFEDPYSDTDLWSIIGYNKASLDAFIEAIESSTGVNLAKTSIGRCQHFNEDITLNNVLVSVINLLTASGDARIVYDNDDGMHDAYIPISIDDVYYADDTRDEERDEIYEFDDDAEDEEDDEDDENPLAYLGNAISPFRDIDEEDDEDNECEVKQRVNEVLIRRGLIRE